MKFRELKDKIFMNYESGAISDDQLIDIIETAVNYLSLKTTTGHKNRIKKSYNAVKRFVNPDIIIDNIKFYKDTN